MNKKEASILFEKIGGREGVAKRALEIAQDIIEVGAYKRAVAGAGQLRVLSEIAEKGDCYWSEIEYRGRRVELDHLKHGCKKPYLRHDGNLNWEKTEPKQPEGAED